MPEDQPAVSDVLLASSESDVRRWFPAFRVLRPRLDDETFVQLDAGLGTYRDGLGEVCAFSSFESIAGKIPTRLAISATKAPAATR